MTYTRAQLEFCARGTVSSWSSGTRTPSNPELCQACTANTYAARIGEGRFRRSSVGLCCRSRCAVLLWLLPAGYPPAAGSRLGSVPPLLRCAGMSSCQPCPGGTAPTTSAGAGGPDTCTKCSGNTYRPFTSTSSTCLTCLAGGETSPTGYTQCAPW